MHTGRLTRRVWFQRRREEIFPFFADAVNLEEITPPWLEFQIVTPLPIEMRRGTVIDYRLRLRGVPLIWQTEITDWNPPCGFADVQRRGPYRSWIHQHSFSESDNGTLVEDQVVYSVTGGRLVDRLFVRPELEKIFDYRGRQLSELLGSADKFGAKN